MIASRHLRMSRGSHLSDCHISGASNSDGSEGLSPQSIMHMERGSMHDITIWLGSRLRRVPKTLACTKFPRAWGRGG